MDRKLIVLLLILLIHGQRVAAQEVGERAGAVLRKHCHRCHGEKGQAEGGLNYLLDRHRLVEQKKVAPGAPDKSLLLERVKKGDMPPADVKERPSAAEIEALDAWVKAGAPELSPPVKRRIVSHDAMVAQIWKDLAGLSAVERGFTRYFTLTHLQNAGCSEDELETCRLGLSKLLNSTSWAPKIARPVAIDLERTIFRIDLRHYRWQKAAWNHVALTHPYGLVGRSELEDKCREVTGTDKFFLRADWFAVHATTPHGYYALLGVPAALQELERILGVDVRENIATGQVQRSGFRGSQVTQFARLIERHESHFGALWITYNFSEDKTLFDNPTGAYLFHDLVKAQAQETLFHLPNGLLGFAVWDTNTFRHQAVQAHALRDVRKVGAPVLAGLSCMSCHTQGVIARDDQMQKFFAGTKAGANPFHAGRMRTMYPSKEKFRELTEADSRRYLDALAKTGCQPGTADPVVVLALRHEEELNLARAAGELGLAPGDLAKQLKSKAKYAALAEQLEQHGVSRLAFAKAMPGLVQELDLGTLQQRGIGAVKVYAEMALPPRGELPVLETVVVKSTDNPTKPTTTPVKPSPEKPTRPVVVDAKPIDLGDGLQVVAAKDFLACRFQERGLAARAVAISRDRKVAIETQRGTVTLFDPFTMEVVREFSGYKGPLQAVDFSPDGKLLATVGLDNAVKVWRVGTGLNFLNLEHSGPVQSLRFTPDGKHIITQGDQLFIWDATSGARTFTLGARIGPKGDILKWEAITCFAISADGSTLAVGGRSLRVINMNTKVELGIKKPLEAKFSALALSPDGKTIAAGAGRNLILWDVKTQEVKATLESFLEPAHSLAFTADGKYLLAAANPWGGGQDPGGVNIFEVEFGSLRRTLSGKRASVASMRLSGDGTLIVTGCGDNCVRIWPWDKSVQLETKRKRPLLPFEGHFGGIHCLASSPDGKLVVTGGADGARVWDGATGKELQRLDVGEVDVTAVTVSADGKLAYTVTGDRTWQKWDLETGMLLKRSEPQENVFAHVFSGRGNFLATLMSDNFIRLYDNSQGRRIRDLEAPTRTGWITMSDDGRILLALGSDGMRAYETATGKATNLLFPWKKGSPNLRLALSPSGRYLAQAGDDRMVSVWDLKKNEEVHKIGEFPTAIHDLHFTGDGHLLIASGLVTTFGKNAGNNCSVVKFQFSTGRIAQYWDEFPRTPAHVVGAAEGREIWAVVGGSLLRLSADRAKTVAEN